MHPDAIKPGDIIAGRYRVRAILGRSRGLLVDASHVANNQRFAIRILSPALVDDREVQRFRREARTLARLRSEHVARIADIGKTPDGALYFVRPYFEGQDLAAALHQRGSFPLSEAVLVILQAAEAVAECHANGVLLRELQPAHIFLARRPGASPQVEIIDFGTAKLMRDTTGASGAGAEHTSTAMCGLSCYSSPELVRRAPDIDARTDVWSLGAILYQLLTGRPPFEGEMAGLMLAIARDEPIAVTRYRRDVPREIDQIIGWALAKDVHGRFANVHGFAHSLLPFASPEGRSLVQRIGEITAAPRPQAFGQSSVLSGFDAVPIDDDDLLDEDSDEVRTEYRPANAPVVGPAYQGPDAVKPLSLERTEFIGPGFIPSSPSAMAAMLGLAPDDGPQRSELATLDKTQAISPEMAVGLLPGYATAQAPPPTPPVWQPIPQAGTPPRTPDPPPAPAPVMLPGGARPPIPASALMTIQSSYAGSHSAGGAPHPRGAKIALLALGGAILLLSIVAVIVVLKGHPGGGSASSAAVTATAAAPTATASAAPTATAPAASDVPSADAAANDPANGTLIAVVIGGSCTFSVNGAGKGTTSTLKLSLEPGSYTVTCKPAKGASQAKKVTVKRGDTATASFKL